MLLMRDGLDDLLYSPPPSKPDDEFLKRDKQARAIINLCIDDSQIIHVRDETTTAGTWQKLKSIHERSNLSSKLYLLRKLYSIKMAEHGDMIAHITHMMDLVERLKAIGENIPDQHVAALMLVSIPESYNNLITAIEAREETLITTDLVKTKLTDEYNRRLEQQADRSSNSSTAFKSAINARNYDNSRQKKFCTFCKRSGHTRERCFKLQNKSNNSCPDNSKSETRVAKHVGKSTRHCMSADTFEERRSESDTHRHVSKPVQSTVYEKGLIITPRYCSEQNINKKILYMDSGASSHLVGDESLFTELIYEDSRAKIILADGKILYSQGRGFVDLNLEEACGLQKIRLTNVYYVPDLTPSRRLSCQRASNEHTHFPADTQACQSVFPFSPDCHVFVPVSWNVLKTIISTTRWHYESQVIRVGGILQEANLPFNTKTLLSCQKKS
ncbi:Retrovirus-related Pol polyprotein from transposon TNT 1-94, partial [Stegodyphus mimosarum]